MLYDFDFTRITDPLLSWYAGHARVLPWREHITPYRVWVSEIMLQQTRVEAVKPYFERFMEALPTVRDLAECREDRLLKLWEGLGYYNRARNLQTAAQEIMEKYNGEIPADYEKLLSLKGIGHYTAGAVSSIAFGIPMPAVDGNVLRVIMRVCADDSDISKQSVKTEVENTLLRIMPADHAADFNQALMELGATVCLPNGEPKCSDCPWHSFCEAAKRNLRTQLPRKSRSGPRRTEKRTVLLIRDGEKIVLRKRPGRGLLSGMYEFPNLEGHLNREEALQAVRRMRLHPLQISRLTDAKHIFSHIEWHMTGYAVRVDSLTRQESDMLFVDIRDARADFPIPSAFAAYTKYLTAWEEKIQNPCTDR